VFDIYPDSSLSGLTEYGISSTSDVDIIKKIIPADQLWPPKIKSSWKDHHAFMAWDVEKES